MHALGASMVPRVIIDGLSVRDGKVCVLLHFHGEVGNKTQKLSKQTVGTERGGG